MHKIVRLEVLTNVSCDELLLSVVSNMNWVCAKIHDVSMKSFVWNFH